MASENIKKILNLLILVSIILCSTSIIGVRSVFANDTKDEDKINCSDEWDSGSIIDNTDEEIGLSEAGKVVNRSLICPTTKGRSDYSKSLLYDVPGIALAYKGNPDSIAELNSRITALKELAKELIKVQSQLSKEKELADKIADQWNFNPVHFLGGFNDDEDDIRFNRKRRIIIKKMIDNASEKIKVVEIERANNERKIASITLDEAIKSEDPELIAQAETQLKTAQEESRATRVELQEEIAAQKALDDQACWPGGSLTPNIGNCILIATAWIGNMITWVFSLLLFVASKVFDLSVWVSISLIKQWFSTEAIINIWKLCRDLANLCFVFVLLYIALGTVFELAGMGDTRKLIVGVIIAALFVNFSGFFVRVIVDASNILAYEFYIQLKGPNGDESISTSLVKKMDLGHYFIDAKALKDATGQAGKAISPPIISRLSFIGIIGQTFGNIIIILVTSFILITAAILFLIRTIYLLFLYMFSPIAFVSKIIPSSKFNFYDMWMDKLIKQSFFAPAFLIPFYLVFKLLGENGISSLGSSPNSWGGLVGGGSLSLVFANAVIIGLLMGCIFIANSLGAAGAKMATSIAGGATLLGTKGIVRGSRFVGRQGFNITKKSASVARRGLSAPTTRLSNWAERTMNERNTVISPKKWAAQAIQGVESLERRGRTVAGSMAGGVVRGSQYVGNTRAGKAIGETTKNLAKEALKSAPAQKVADIVKNPLLAASDAVVDIQAAMTSGGGGSYSFMGKTGKERADSKKSAKDKEKEEKEEAKKEKIDRITKMLRTATEAEAATIMGDLTDPEIKDLPNEILARDEVSRNLTHSNLDALQKKGEIPRAQKRAMQIAITRTPATPGVGYMLGPNGSFWS